MSRIFLTRATLDRMHAESLTWGGMMVEESVLQDGVEMSDEQLARLDTIRGEGESYDALINRLIDAQPEGRDGTD